MTILPSLFVSHGAPTLAVEDGPARRFLLELGARLPRPRAIVVVSAHHDTAVTEITGVAEPETIHDFGGFPQALYELRYPAPGEPHLADDLVVTLQASGIEARVNPTRGLDHGAWVPLMLVYPEADVPVVQVSIDSVLSAVEEGPHGRGNHPTMDHIHPLFFAYGAGGASGRGARLHHSTTYGVLAMDVYAFGNIETIERL